MLRTLKILYILLQVLVLMRTAITLEDMNMDYYDPEQKELSSFQCIDIDDYVSSNQNFSDSVTVKNEVSQEGSSSENIPSEPTFLRAFVEFDNGLIKKDRFVTIRWNQPNSTKGEIEKYRVQYWSENSNQTIRNNIEIIPKNDKILQYKVHNLKPDTMYYFKVQACNAFGAGPYTFINVSTTYEHPVPLLFLSIYHEFYADVFDTDLQICLKLDKGITYIGYVYSALEHKIYGITDKSKLITTDFNPNTMQMNPDYTKIADLEDYASDLCIDWIHRHLYWIKRPRQYMDEEYIAKLDLTLWQQMGIAKFDKLIKTNDARFLNISPSGRYLYWSELFPSPYLKRYINMMIPSDFNGTKTVLWKYDTCSCQYELEQSSFVQIDTTNDDKPLIYWVLRDHLLIVTDINGCRCNLILSAENETKFEYLLIDKINIYLVKGDYYNIMYILKKKNDILESKENALQRVKKISMPNIYNDVRYQLFPLVRSSQLYPPTICLIPKMEDYRVEEVFINGNSIEVNLPKPILNDGCEKYNLSTTIYNISISYLTCLDNDSKKIEQFNIVTYERHYKFQNLTLLTEYTLKLALNNFYVNKLSMDLRFGSDIVLKTIADKLNAPEDVNIEILTPTLAIVHWMPLEKLNCVKVNYEVYWLLIPNITQNISYQPDKKLIENKPNRTVDGKFFTIIQLLPKQNYQIYVRVYPTNFSHLFTDSLFKTIYMSDLNNLNLTGVSSNSMNISWIPSINLTMHTKFRTILEYKNDVMQKWQIAHNIEVNNNNKITYYINRLLPQTSYKFRLILKYPEYMDEDFIWPPDEKFTFRTLKFIKIPATQDSYLYNYLPLILSIIATIVIWYVYYFYCSYQQRNQNKQIISTSLGSTNDIELPTDENSEPNSVHDPVSPINLNEFEGIIIDTEQFTLEKFLGSGNFGMVYQGTMKNLKKSEKTPVAVKMLPEDTSSQQKNEFLKEAQLMRDFDHKHVLKLLGIYIYAGSPCLILELMEANLLLHLRESQNLQPSDPHSLRLRDLISMCEDVARGCDYLEKQHFVHRDLACRNCLISSRNREHRIVKVSDFGLARDIYGQDYYRMGRRIPLPVRWMAPESLESKRFTSQSDVWAFGILMWEITSLGQHPYAAIPNYKIKDHVCAGNKLSKPHNCPGELYELMLSCWNKVGSRPKFRSCVEKIETLKGNIQDAMLIL